MKTSLVMNFSVDKENKKIKVEREFAAPLEKVWAAWTDSKILDRWWAPKPWQAKTKSMDFKTGGSWLYAMVGPGNETHWARADYKSVNPMKSFSGLDGFCDENGNLNADLPRSIWNVTFSPMSDSTMVNIETTYSSLDDLEKIIAMGFKEGFTAALENLDGLLNA